MKRKILWLSVATVFISVIVFGIASTIMYYNSSVDSGEEYLKVYMNSFDSSKYSFDKTGAEEFSSVLGGARVTFIDGDGFVIADSGENISGSDHSKREEFVIAKRTGEGFAVRSSSTLGKRMMYYCRADKSGNFVRISAFTDTYWMIFIKTLPTVAPFFFVMLALCVIFASLSKDFVLKPVKKLAEEAVRTDSVVTKEEELKPIADILNERSRNIKKQMAEIKEEKELVEKERLSKDEFISNVTHEMNTPLTSIHGYAELLSAGGMIEEQKSAAYRTIISQSERLTNLITCIINYSEIESDTAENYEVNFSGIARDMIDSLKPEFDKRNITVEENILDNVIVSSRNEYVTEITGNLIRNAIKYNKDGGKITVALDKTGFTVEDTGIGIKEEDLPKVFSRFFTADKSHGGKNGGFGLGLAVVKKICLKHGWRIGVKSEYGKGSKFTVNF